MFKINLKIIFLFFAFFYLISATLFYNFYKELVIEDAKKEVTAILNTTNALRDYVENVQKPVIYELKADGKLSEDYFDPKILSASYIARNIHQRYAQKQVAEKKIPYQYKLAATNARNPDNKADAFEAEILNQFRDGKMSEYSTILKENGQEYFFTAIPIDKNKDSCMLCHSYPEAAPKELTDLYGTSAGFHEKIGDVRAMISLKFPVSHILKTHNKKFLLSSFVVLVIFVIFYLFIYIIYKKDLKIQAEQEQLLLHQNKLASMGEMIGNIAHQWRQPLTQLSSILINIELHHEMNKLSKEKLLGKIDEANEQISYMSATIDDFRNFFASGKEVQQYNIKEVVELVIHLMSASLANAKIQLKVDIKEDFFLSGYPNEIVQAMVNIIHNAKDVIKEREIKNPQICIKTFDDAQQRHTITIEDNAGGIDKSIIDKIFDPYFTTKHTSVGTGIGLYMTKTIIEKNNNGTINVSNINDGAIFTIIF